MATLTRGQKIKALLANAAVNALAGATGKCKRRRPSQRRRPRRQQRVGGGFLSRILLGGLGGALGGGKKKSSFLFRNKPGFGRYNGNRVSPGYVSNYRISDGRRKGGGFLSRILLGGLGGALGGGRKRPRRRVGKGILSRILLGGLGGALGGGSRRRRGGSLATVRF